MTTDKGGVTIRRMIEADLARVNFIDQSLVGGARSSTWPFSFESYWRVYHPELGFVAEINREVVGFLVGHLTEERTPTVFSWAHLLHHPREHKKVGWIDMTGILEAHQGKAIGKAMVDEFQKECRSKGAVVGWLIKDDDKRLKGFVTAVGFKKWEIDTYERE